MVKYSPEERQRILAAGRQAIADAEEVLDRPRPQGAELPPCETRSQRWRREADEQEQRFAAERAASQPLTSFEASRLEARLTAQIGTQLAAQKELIMGVLAELLAGLRDESETFDGELSARLGDFIAAELGRAERRLAKAAAFNKKSEPGGEVIDLPNPFRKRA